jgi:exodeoxyribonuclease V gamma subunit
MLCLHRADRADALTAALADVFVEPLGDPFAPEIVAVPTHGVERWLTQQLSTTLGARTDRADGICANVLFPSPRRLVDEAIAAANGSDPEHDLWKPRRLLWPLLGVMEAALSEPWLAPLRAHLEPRNGDRSRQLRSAQHLAVLFDRYATYRSEMLRAWRDGRDEDGGGGLLGSDHRWQAELWRRVREHIGGSDPVETLANACAKITADRDVVSLPERAAIFGLTALPARQLRLLHALATHRDVHLFLLHPSAASWDAVSASVAQRGYVPAARAEASEILPAHPLLASWGRDAREFQLLLARQHAGARETGAHHPSPASGDTLLARIQAGLRADQAPARPGTGPADARSVLADDDRSVEIHACHGRARQVEVLRDAILHALADDPDLEPRDIVVMCPDIEAFAPLVEATFGAGQELADPGDGDAALPAPSTVRAAGLRVRLADRALRQTNPVLALVTRLFELTTGRVTASEVLDLADRDVVRHRFRLEQDDVARLEEWVTASGIRWGLDAAHREQFHLGQVTEGTWHAGLERLVAGVALAEDGPRMFAGVLPFDDIDSSSIDLGGRFAEMLDRLQTVIADWSEPKTISAWTVAIADGVDALGATLPSEAWQRAELQRLLVDALDEATTDDEPSQALLDVTDVAALLSDRLAGRPTRANFRTGHLTVCTLQPMRSVPHRVVCLLGLDDTTFPRRSRRDGDDVLLLASQVGDPDPRAEDRQILLDALLAATDRLVITYTGNDERTNATRAPAVPVGELLDVVDRTARRADGSPARARVLVRHPLQAFDTRNFEPGAIRATTPWSFDTTTLEGARSLIAERSAPRPFLNRPLPPVSQPIIDLDDLVQFVGHPVRAFLAQRLEIRMARDDDAVDDAMPIELDGLQRWAIGQRLLEARLRGADAAEAIAAERARGSLPPGEIGAAMIATMAPELRAILTTAEDIGLDIRGAHAALDAQVTLRDGSTVGGTVASLIGDVIQTVTFSRVSARQRLGSWVRLLLLSAAYPERPFSTATVGRARRSASNAAVTIARIAPLGDDPESRRSRSLIELETLVGLYARGMREPLPIFCETSAAYAAGGTAAEAAARRAWVSPFGEEHEDKDELHVLVFGRERPFEWLLRQPPREDEQGEGWDDDEPSRFGRLAHRMWSGLRACEQVSET